MNKRTLLAALSFAPLAACGGMFAIDKWPKVDVREDEDEIRTAVIAAAKAEGFGVERVMPHLVQVSYPGKAGPEFERRHARYQVLITGHSYLIRYMDSVGLNASRCSMGSSGWCADRTVDTWMGRLDKAIRDRLSVISRNRSLLSF
ncbi:MAG: hypothetical protein MR009_06860 [Sutterellaceae bacterium]|nr:hypothetical protein [Sutterellaceae bacterium]MDD7442964.1 hypothetical protein [Sutterellaceae bacterium]MDY2868667.1 hypothetical protein [Mesosutterella sp.]